jgi:hypothetical protein
VARFGGRIWAEESRLGGTAIRFALPIQMPATAEAAE